ncbi:MAG TPA: AbrB/MazE/SpoVT family DNA-binding domain-containing protein [Bdellovibrionota bacterium]|nr:AbrB/MazE/SpoVT family DNA-binding domain-containing protein [Bdellovibrionota bacterium]
MTVKVSPKYQVVIPEAVRNILGLRPGAKVEVIAKGGVAYLVPVSSLKDVQRKLGGKIDRTNLREKGDRDL